jgi:hypothetical protein
MWRRCVIKRTRILDFVHPLVLFIETQRDGIRFCVSHQVKVENLIVWLIR